MDADWIENQRDQFISRREKRWSMNSQRLEEIVAELMRPINNDVRRSFDTDLSALLEEYLTEAGLHALDAEDSGLDSSSGSGVADPPPNFAVIAMLLQQSATLYGRKVDCLYQNVLSVSDSLHNSTLELANLNASTEEPQTPTTANRRKRKASSGPGDFVEIFVEACGGAAREAEAPRPPPTLPRMYIELEPRVVTAADVPLFDYAAESIGLLSDYQVTWRLHDGLLVDELEGGSLNSDPTLRPISLVELQAAIEAASPDSPPPAPPPRDDSPLRELSPLRASTPLPQSPPARDCPTEMKPPPTPVTAIVKKERKRRSEVKIDELFNGTIKLLIGKELMRQLKQVQDFTLSEKWIASVIQKRKSHILSERKRLSLEETQPPDGFAGWSSVEVALARQAARLAPVTSPSLAATATEAGAAADDDDGFFEQSSGEDVEQELQKVLQEQAEAAAAGGEVSAAGAAEAESAAWRLSILRRAVASARRGALDVRALGGKVLRALDATEEKPRPFRALLQEHVRHETDVSRLFLASLFLANSGNVEIVSGPPLSMDSFSLRLLSRDMHRYSAVTSEDEQLSR